MMTVYHFTARHLLPSILKEGITLGCIPLNMKEVRDGFQWVTINPEFRQSWNGQVNVKYDRCAVRLTVEIPSIWRHKVLNWLQVCKKMTEIHDVLNSFGDPENWRLYRGKIRPEWIKAVEIKP